MKTSPLGGVHLSIDTKLSNHHENNGFINSVLSQTFSDNNALAMLIFSIMLVAFIVGVVLLYVLFRGMSYHDYAIRKMESRLRRLQNNDASLATI